VVKINGYTIPAHISHSQITTWLACGWKYFLTRIAGTQESGTWWLVGGSALHEASEAYDRKLWQEQGK
jgi:hypothetical protein